MAFCATHEPGKRLPEAERAELAAILRAHAERYPRMQPPGAGKLFYQNEFGSGHLIADPAASLARLANGIRRGKRGIPFRIAFRVGRLRLCALQHVKKVLFQRLFFVLAEPEVARFVQLKHLRARQTAPHERKRTREGDKFIPG